ASLPSGWRVEVIPPGAGEPGDDIGYVELAGFSPDGRRLLVARELRTSARLTRRFELFAPDSTRVEPWASSAAHLRAPSPRPLPAVRSRQPPLRALVQQRRPPARLPALGLAALAAEHAGA